MDQSNSYGAYDQMMAGLFEYFGVDYRAKRVATLWKHLRESAIPTWAWVQIGDRLKRTLDGNRPLEGNLGLRIVEAWSEVRKTAQSGTNREKVFCEHCGGVGHFSATRMEPPYPVPVTYTFRCAKCENWYGELGTAIPAANPDLMKAQGWKLQFASGVDNGDRQYRGPVKLGNTTKAVEASR
jgi:hypothetical protein